MRYLGSMILVGLLLATVPATAATDFTELTSRLVRLRREVETLSNEADMEQKRQRGEWESLVARKAEADAQLRKERLREAQLREKSVALRSRIKEVEKADPAGKKTLAEWIDGLRRILEASIPFRRAERLAELSAIEARLKRGDSTVNVLRDLWSFTHKQIRLSRDNAFEITSLEIDGTGTKKAEIARLGLAQLAFVTADGESGFARRQQGQWTLASAKTSGERAAAERLVKKFREKSISGYFEVPRPDLTVKE